MLGWSVKHGFRPVRDRGVAVEYARGSWRLWRVGRRWWQLDREGDPAASCAGRSKRAMIRIADAIDQAEASQRRGIDRRPQS